MARSCSVEGCDRPLKALGLCSMHYRRQKRHGAPTGGRAPNGTKLDWLLEHASYDGGECLKWPFRSAGRGYGLLRYERTTSPASRVMCFLVHGEPPDKRDHAAHSCGNGDEGCVNPRHLRWASCSSNHADKVLHGTDMRGEKHHNVRLSEADVRCIRTLIVSKSQRSIATEYGVSRRTVCDILERKTWTWLE